MQARFPMLFLMLSLVGLGAELVRNGGFGGGNATYGELPPEWKLVSGQAGSLVYVNDDGLGDSHSLRGNDSGIVAQEVELRGGVTYRLSASLKDAGGKPQVQVLDGEGQVLCGIGGDGLQSQVWERCQVAFECGKAGRHTVRILSFGKCWIDDVSLVDDVVAVAEPAKGVEAGTGKLVNLALGCKYELSPTPNYGYCRDVDDIKQLTDGVYTVGYFWTQKSTVGWRSSTVSTVTIDLGSEKPIRGFSWNTAAGVAGVTWPKAILIFVSSDKKTWHWQGDLVIRSNEVNGKPPAGKYAVHRYHAENFSTKGRWVCFQAINSPYAFVDEVEVYEGPAENMTRPIGGKTYTDTKSHHLETLIQSLLLSQLVDLRERSKGYGESVHGLVDVELKRCREQIEAMPVPEMESFRSIVPLGSVHESLLSANRHLLRAGGIKAPMFWRNNRWDNLDMFEVPKPGVSVEPLVVELMRNEVRGETVNIANPLDKALDCQVSVSGLPDDAGVDIRQVLYTATKEEGVISAALKPLEDGKLRLLSGISTQLWISFKRPQSKAGRYDGKLHLSWDGGSMECGLSLIVHDLDMPSNPSLHSGGWDYTNLKGNYYRNPGNLEANLAMMREIYVDSPWGTGATAPAGGTFDEEGNLTDVASLDFKKWDEWVDMWKGARNYCVFLSVSDKFRGEPMGTPRFERMIDGYFHAWTDHMEAQGLKGEQLLVLLCDEPPLHNCHEIIKVWGQAMKKAKVTCKIFEDPIWTDVDKADADMFEVCDIICPNTVHWVMGGKKFRDYYLAQQQKGRELYFYSCSGPAKLLDPITYHRLQHWVCIAMDGKGAFYWALGCGGGGNSWQTFLQPGTEYSPYFVGKTDAMEGKHSEAIREGVQDYEYYQMLKAKAAKLKAAGKSAKRIEDFLAESAWRALKPYIDDGEGKAPKAYNSWSEPRDRSSFDRIRLEALRLLGE